jgi:multiple sugar transport system ATP-binding protein
MARLVLTGLRKSYGEIRAVDGVSLSLEEGEFMVVVGPTGCGKSTLLRLIAGVDRADAGHIVLDGVRMNDIPLGQRGIQMIFQGYALWPHMRVFDERRYSNLGFALKVRKWIPGSIVRRVRDVMRRVGIEEDLSGRRPDELSSGQQQKVAIGRAIALPPRVFLLDEPMANIDPVAKRQVRAELRRVHDELGAVTLLVTHDLADAFQLADRIAVMREGRILQVDTPRRLVEAPADPFVEQFLSSFAPLWWERAKEGGGRDLGF